MLDIQQTISAFENLHVLIVGDVMLDEYIEGKVSRISPEAPVPIVEIQHKRHCAGGAANVALNIQSLGAIPHLCSVIGKDDKGFKLIESLEAHSIDASYLFQSKHRKTTCKKRILSKGQQLIRIDEEDQHSLTERETAKFLAVVQQIVLEQAIDVIIFQDYNKGVLYPKTIRSILLSAIRDGIPTVVDPKSKYFYEYKGVSLFKPNLREINDQVPFNVEPTLLSLQEANAYLSDRLRNQETLITLSSNGLFYSNKDQSFIVPTTPRKIADVCGAGDTVVSVAALGIASRIKREEIAILCNLAGGQVCEIVGVAPVDKIKLAEDYKTYRQLIF